MNDYIQPTKKRRSAVIPALDSSDDAEGKDGDDSSNDNSNNNSVANTKKDQPEQAVSPVRLRGGGISDDEGGGGGQNAMKAASERSVGSRGRSRRTGITNQSESGSMSARRQHATLIGSGSQHGKRATSLSRSHVNVARAEHRRAKTSTAGTEGGGGRQATRRSSSVGALHSHHGRRGHVITGVLDDPTATATTTGGAGGTPGPAMEKVSSNSGFNRSRGYHASAFVKQDSDARDSVSTFDGAFDVGGNAYALEKPRSVSPLEPKEIGDSGASSIFARRGDKDLRQVDQSVNLMDAEAGNYQYTRERPPRQKKKPAPRQSILAYMFAGVKRTTSKSASMASMEEIDLGPDPSRRRMTHFYLQQKAAQENDPCHKCYTCLSKVFKYIRRLICSPPFLAAVVIVVTLIFIPYIQDAVNSLPSTPAPTEAPTTSIASPQPTAAMPTATEEDTGSVAVADQAQDKGNDNNTAVDDQASSDSTPVTADEGGVVSQKNASPSKTKSSNNFFDRVKTFFSPSPPESLPENAPNPQTNGQGWQAFSPDEEARFEEMVSRMVEIQNLIWSRNLTSIQDLHDPASPQNMALAWLITTTTTPRKGSESSQRNRRLDGDVPAGGSGEDSRTVERYVAAVLFFSFHDASEIEEMHNKLYYSHHYDHIWKESDLWVHGYGYDGLPIGKGSNYSYAESFYYQYYGNYSDYYNEKSNSGGDHSDYYQYYYGMDESEYWKYYDEEGNLLWDASEFEEDSSHNKSRPPRGHLSSTGKPKNEERNLKGNPMPQSVDGAKLFASILDSVVHDDKDVDVTMGQYFDRGVPEDNYRYFDPEGKPLHDKEDAIPVEFEQDDDQKGTPRNVRWLSSNLRRRLGEEEETRSARRSHLRRLDSLLHGEWMSDKNICEWNGIECNDNHQVVKLCLHQHYLKGRIPSEIVGFENLKILDLSKNHLHGSIPEEISSLEYLQQLLLQGNKLTGELPSTFEDNSLVMLRLEHNKLNGTMPIAITALASLEELWLNHNMLSGTLPIELERLGELRKLHLEGNRFTGQVHLRRNVAQLQTLRLHHNELSGLISTGDAICKATKNHSLHFLSADCKTGVIVCDCCHECF